MGTKIDPASDEARLKTLKALHEKRRELQAQIYDLDQESARILNGEKGVVQETKELEAAFNELWQGRYGHTPYVWNFAQDRAQWRRLLKMFTPPEIEERIGRYIRNDDPFFVKNRHTFGLFVRSINQHAPTPAPIEEPNPFEWNCPHTPRCGNRATCDYVQTKAEDRPF